MATEEKYLNIILDEEANNNERSNAIRMLKHSLGNVDRTALVARYLKPKAVRSTNKKTKAQLEEDLNIVASHNFTLRTKNEALQAKISQLKSTEFSYKILNKVGEMPVIFLMGWACALLPWFASIWTGFFLFGYLYVSFNFDLRRLKE